MRTSDGNYGAAYGDRPECDLFGERAVGSAEALAAGEEADVLERHRFSAARSGFGERPGRAAERGRLRAAPFRCPGAVDAREDGRQQLVVPAQVIEALRTSNVHPCPSERQAAGEFVQRRADLCLHGQPIDSR